ncbi:MAG: HAMP domain-containing histidine kinase [Lachnospiraceae bacterium]|nr:HAMP domain-containing histidine kinase [Lachnospiraceae bacterium]
MYITIGILSGVILLLILILLIFVRQIQDICRQLLFFTKQDSNIRITSQISCGGVGKLVDILNMIVKERRENKKKYMDKEVYLSDVYTNLSHDIRTPLTSLDGYIQLLEECENKEEQKRYLWIVRERIHSLKEILEELFTFSKLKNETYHLELTECCINRILRQTVFSYYEDWTKLGIQPEFDIEEIPIYMEGNEQALFRVFQNVMKNAIDHGEQKIGIFLSSSQNVVCVQICNEISKTEEIEIDQVFERFYKADASRNKNSTGLGLSIAKEFVLRMNGTIVAQLEEQEFSIIMKFPIIKKNKSVINI